MPEHINLHIIGLSETQLKDHKSTEVFKINGFQTPFRKDNDSNGGVGLLVHVRNGINAKRRDGLETNNIPCLWPFFYICLIGILCINIDPIVLSC